MVGAAARWPVQSKRETIAGARTASQAPASTLGQARPSIGTSKGKGPGPLARPGANGANIAKPYKGSECSNGYRQRGRCDSRPDWHRLTVLISSAARHDPHRRAVIDRDPHRRASGVHDPHRRGQRDHDQQRLRWPDPIPYRQGRPSRSVPASCDSAGLAQARLYYSAPVLLCLYAHMRISPYRYMIICGKAHNENDSHYHSHAGKIDQGPDTPLAGPLIRP